MDPTSVLSKAELIFVLVVCLLLSTCGDKGSTGRSPSKPEEASSPIPEPAVREPTILEVDDARNGDSVTLRPGDLLVVRLRAQPGTGYSWRIATPPPPVLERVGEPAMEETPADQPGAVERVRFEFRAKTVGRATLVLEYVRPWERDAEPARVFKIAVEVQR